MSATPTLVRDGQRVLLVRCFTENLSSPYDGIKWVKRSAKITEKDGTVVFQMDDIEAPEFWSQLAVDIAASKYFRKAGVPVTGREISVRQMIDRVAGAIANQGLVQGYFDVDAALVLKDELTYLLVHQYAAFNSPVWFNAGLAENYNARGSASGLWAVDKAGVAHEMPDAYTRPALSACFIQTVDDNLMGIADGVKREMRVFKMGGGSGANYSNLRAEGESLSGGGKSSGVMSFLGIFDAAAGAIKSGGTVRRAARMVVLNADHPDVETFVEWKVREEKKVEALVAAGYSSDFNGEAYRTVGGQNANNSVRVTDAFMNAVKTDADWSTIYRTNKKIAKTFKARSLMRKIAEAAHACADPGMQFDTTCNAWHTTPEAGRQNSTNPCQPAWATVLTPGGITTLAEVGAGDHIWSGSQWTKITKKWSTGVKPVYAFKTRAGVFHGTENHRVVQHGEKIEVSQAESIDSSVCLDNDHLELRAGLKPADVMDGLVFGDGMVHKASKNLPPLLCVGEKDKDYFKSEVQGLFVEDRLALSPLAWAVETTLSRDEVPKTYERKVPDRFKYGHIAKVRGFLRGLYSANGSVIDGKGGSRVTLKAASFDTIESVQQMLSFLGIRSYYTTNKAHPVKFENGVYECRQSYDLNVTTDRVRFQKLIGFIQADKQERLEAACQRPVTGRCKTTYEIVERESLGEEEVFDLTVEDDAHTYWTGGLLVSNCSEYSYVDNSACNLASLNLQKFMDDRGFDVEGFCHAVDVFITAMDLIVDYASYPTKEIAENSHNLRPLGLGYANLGALLMRLGLPYDSTHGRAVCGMVTSLMTARAYRRSSQLAAGVGPFKGFAFNREPMLGVIRRHSYAMVKIPPFVPASSGALTEIYSSLSSLNTASIENWQDAYSFGGVHGYRNGQATLLAPTGTIGLLMDCDTTGIEPDYALVKFKKLAGGGAFKIVNQSVGPALEHLGYRLGEVSDILKYIEQKNTIEGAPYLKPEHLAVFDCAAKNGETGQRALAPMSHLHMMAAAQPFLSGAISKTVNCPEETTVEEIEKIYITAWELGLKAVAVYREGSKICAILSGKSEKSKPAAPVTPFVAKLEEKLNEDRKANARPERRRLPKRRKGFTQEVMIGEHKLYLRTGDYEDGKLGEVFLDMHKQGATMSAMLDSFAKLLSISIQHGVPLEEIVEKFIHTKFEPKGLVRHDPNIKVATSILDYVFRTLAIEYLGRTDLANRPIEERDQVESHAVTKAPIHLNGGQKKPVYSNKAGETCSVCGDITVRAGTCTVCVNCGSNSGCG